MCVFFGTLSFLLATLLDFSFAGARNLLFGDEDICIIRDGVIFFLKKRGGGRGLMAQNGKRM